MTDAGMIRIGAACAILSSALLGAAALAAVWKGLPWGTPRLRPAAGLAALHARRPAFLLRQVLLFAATLLLFPLGPALARALGAAGAIAEAAAAAWMAGVALAVANDMLVLAALVRVMPTRAADAGGGFAASGRSRATIDAAVLASQLAGDALLIGVGAGLFSLAVLRTRALPEWLGWMGIVAAVLAGGVHRPARLLGRARGAAVRAGALGFIVFVLWLAALGLLLTRQGGLSRGVRPAPGASGARAAVGRQRLQTETGTGQRDARAGGG